MCSGRAFSPWEMSKKIASSIKDFALETLLMRAIQDEKLHDGKGTEEDLSEGTGFEPVHTAGPVPNATPAHFPPMPCPPSLHSATGTANMTESSSAVESDATDSDTAAPTTLKQKHQSKAMIAYKKLAFKKRRAADRQCAKANLDPDANIRPSIRRQHTTSATPISVPSFSIDAKVPAKMAYVEICDAGASKRVYQLGEMVGERLKFKFNLVEWDGKYIIRPTPLL